MPLGKLTPEQAMATLINPATRYLSNISGYNMHTPNARALLCAIALQESNLEHRRQLPAGTGRGLFQFEGENAGTEEVMINPATAEMAAAACTALGVPFVVKHVHQALAENDYLAVIFARLLLYTDRRGVPAADDDMATWEYYLDNWKPGRPRRSAWANNIHQGRIAAECVLDGLTGPAPVQAPEPEQEIIVAQPDININVGDSTQPVNPTSGPVAPVNRANVPVADRSSANAMRSGWFTSELALSVLALAEPVVTTAIMGSPALGPWGLVASSVFTIARTYLKSVAVKQSGT